MRLVSVLVGAMLALAGCGLSSVFDGGADTRMRKQADDILARWEAAYATAKKPVFAPTGGLAPQLVGENPMYYEKSIWYGQDMVLDVSAPTPGPAELRWPDGSSRPVVPLAAATVVNAISQKSVSSVAGGCKGCEGTVHVTGARLTTMSLDAVDGPVTAPAWELTLADELTKAGAASDSGLIAAAKALMELADQADTRIGKYNVTVKSSEGVLIGDGNIQVNSFRTRPGRSAPPDTPAARRVK